MRSPSLLPEGFAERYWQKEALAISLDTTLVHDISQDIVSLSVEELLKLAATPVAIWKRGAKGQLETARVSRAEAMVHYETGASLNIGFSRPPQSLCGLQLGICSTISVPADHSFINAVAVADGSFTPLHFDPNDNFVVQIKGEKLWRIWPNLEVPNAVHNWVSGRSVAQEARVYLSTPMGAPDEEKVTSIRLRAGQLLYVPRGYLHSVESSGPSLHVNIAVPCYTWIDFFLPYVRRLLLREGHWRENVYDLLCGARAGNSRPQIGAMLGNLAHVIHHLDPNLLVPTLAGDEIAKLLTVNPLVTFDVRTAESNKYVITFHPTLRYLPHSITWAQVEIFELLARTPGPIDTSDRSLIDVADVETRDALLLGLASGWLLPANQ